MKTREKLPPVVMLLFDLLLFLGVGGFAGGAALLLGPDGHIMGFAPDLLKGTPFTNYFIPGLLLFLFVGIYPFFTAYSLYNRPDWRLPTQLNPFKKMHWVWAACFLAGAFVSIWIMAQMAYLGYISNLQPLYFIFGLVIITLTLSSNVRRYFQL